MTAFDDLMSAIDRLPGEARDLVGAYRDELDADRPSRYSATPAQIEAFLAQHFAEDVRLRHQQAVGGRAVSEAAKGVRMESHSPLAGDKFTNGMLFAASHIDPARGGGPYPSALVDLNADKEQR